MMCLKNHNFLKLFFIINFLFLSNSIADNHNIYETLESIQKDIKTLEKAVYSGSVELSNENLGSSIDNNNSEDVLTRHLLKLSEIENQFQQLTNRFEEINFKLDKLTNRLSKVQADNQIRFQDIENSISPGDGIKKTSDKNILPGSSEPQDLGSISYKDSTTSETTQKIESIETTASIVTETFQAHLSCHIGHIRFFQAHGFFTSRTRNEYWNKLLLVGRTVQCVPFLNVS